MNEAGHGIFAQAAHGGLTGENPQRINENLRALVVDKATQFFHRFRPLNTYYYTGGRNKSYGYLDFLPAMRNYDLMVANRDQAIWKTASGTPTKPDDSKLPALDKVLLARGANEWLSPEDELKAFKVDPRFEVNCFASEEDFPELACPIQMRWDDRGRMWVSCSVVYPHLYPGQEARDKIVILEDTDQDGKADKCTTFADDLHVALSFVLDGKGGVYASEQPHLTHLRDTDGDGKADEREIVATGFGCEDSHHSLHDFVWTPGGDLLFRESVFHNSQVETPYGPVRAHNSAWFVYQPKTRKLTSFGNYPNTNPWGVTFDKWGHHVASHPVFASTFHATNAPYPDQHPGAAGMSGLLRRLRPRLCRLPDVAGGDARGLPQGPLQADQPDRNPPLDRKGGPLRRGVCLRSDLLHQPVLHPGRPPLRTTRCRLRLRLVQPGQRPRPVLAP